MANETIYRVIFHNQRQVFDLYARSVSAGDMIGFVVVEALTFGERTQMVVDPSEERLRSEFDGVQRTANLPGDRARSQRHCAARRQGARAQAW